MTKDLNPLEKALADADRETRENSEEGFAGVAADEFDRQVSLMGDVLKGIRQIRDALETMPRSREASLAVTKLDEAWLWASNIPVNPPEDAQDNGHE